MRTGSSCRPLVEYLSPAKRFVVEVGPGGGVLTGELLAAGATVLALELDPEWAEHLRRRFQTPRLEIRVADALELDWTGLPARTLVTGNLPYNVGTAIVERVLRAHPPIDRAAFLLQREVVERMIAEPGDRPYGALSVLVQLRATARKLGIVKPGAFVPPPKVDSAFVGLELHPPPAILAGERSQDFESWIHAAFNQRRKTLPNALAGRYPRERVLAALESANLPATIRAEAIPLFELFQLFAQLENRAREPDPASSSSPGGTILPKGIQTEH